MKSLLKGFVGLAILAMTGCTGGHQQAATHDNIAGAAPVKEPTPTSEQLQRGIPYPAELSQAFMQSCVAGDGSRRSLCGCTLQQIQSNYSYFEFGEATKQWEHHIDTPVKQGMLRIMDDCAATTSSPPQISQQQPSNQIRNTNPSGIIGQDGVFLGKVSNNQYDDKSICNQYSQYGGSYGTQSAWNQYGQYGGTYSDMGAYNPNAQKPPIVLNENGQPIGFLTKNQNIQNRFDPDMFLNLACK